MRRRQFALLETWGQVAAFFNAKEKNMAAVVGQRYEIYNYEKVENDVPQRGEVVTVTGTASYRETAVQLLDDGKKNVRELYERFAAAVLTPGTFAAKQDKITATGTDNLLTAPASAGGQPGKKSIDDFVSRDNFDEVVSAETRTRQEAYQNLQDAINLLVPEGLEDMPDLLASKAPVNSPVFTGVPKMPSKTSVATDNGTLIATEAQVSVKANSYGGNANLVLNTVNAQILLEARESENSVPHDHIPGRAMYIQSDGKLGKWPVWYADDPYADFAGDNAGNYRPVIDEYFRKIRLLRKTDGRLMAVPKPLRTRLATFAEVIGLFLYKEMHPSLGNYDFLKP
jgi:predicted RNase H-like HicB family nuclease